MVIKKIIKTILPKKLLTKIKNRRLLVSLPDNIQNIVKNLQKTDICIDCGANIGNVTSLFLSYGCKVYCFEPNPEAFKVLSKKFSKDKTVVLNNSAVGVKDSKVQLFYHKDYEINPVLFSEASSLINSKNNISKKKKVMVKMINLGKFIKSLTKIKILKIDIEGYETILIPWLIKNDYLQNVEFIFLETHNKTESLNKDTRKLMSLINSSDHAKKFFCNWP